MPVLRVVRPLFLHRLNGARPANSQQANLIAKTNLMSKARREYFRTVFLGTACLGVLLWAAIDQFGIDPDEILALFQLVVIGILGLIVMAAVVAGVWTLLKRVLRR